MTASMSLVISTILLRCYHKKADEPFQDWKKKMVLFMAKATCQSQNYQIFKNKFVKENIQGVFSDLKPKCKCVNNKVSPDLSIGKDDGNEYYQTNLSTMRTVKSCKSYEKILLRTLVSLTEAINGMTNEVHEISHAIHEMRNSKRDEVDCGNPWVIAATIMDRFFMIVLFIIIVLINLVLFGIVPYI